MHPFKHNHLSTRYDRSVESLERVLRSYIKDGADIITLTEVDSEKREKVIRSFEGWGSITGDKTGRDDCAVMWKQSEWEVIHAETFNVAKYMAGNIGAAVAVLQHKHLRYRIVVSVVHLPSSVEGEARVMGGRADEWFLARRNWVRRVKKLKRAYKADAMAIIADWNIDLKKRWVKVLIKSLHPRWKFVWNLSDLPAGGTHGKRIIDFTLIKGKIRVVKRPKIHRTTAASDHRGYDEVLGAKI